MTITEARCREVLAVHVKRDPCGDVSNWPSAAIAAMLAIASEAAKAEQDRVQAIIKDNIRIANIDMADAPGSSDQEVEAAIRGGTLERLATAIRSPEESKT